MLSKNPDIYERGERKKNKQQSCGKNLINTLQTRRVRSPLENEAIWDPLLSKITASIGAM